MKIQFRQEFETTCNPVTRLHHVMSLLVTHFTQLFKKEKMSKNVDILLVVIAFGTTNIT